MKKIPKTIPEGSSILSAYEMEHIHLVSGQQTQFTVGDTDVRP